MTEPEIAYLIAELDVRDPEKLLEYGRRVQPVMARHGGEIVAISGRGARVVEGERKPGLVILHRWRSLADFDAFWDSQEYEPLRKLRHEACGSRIVIFEGVPAPS